MVGDNLESDAQAHFKAFIAEHDLVREVLFALQGRPNTIFETISSEDGLPSVEVRFCRSR